jgi:hypothetical protein
VLTVCGSWRAPVLAALLTGLLAGTSFADEARQVLDDRQAKAAFLFNLIKFVQWPAGGTAIVIGIAGDQALKESIDLVVRGRSVDGRAITTRSLGLAGDPGGCDIVFVAASAGRNATEMLTRQRAAPLTVGETAQFIREGGVIRLFVENRRVRFQISQKNAQAAGVKISSQLFGLAAD